MTTKAKDGRETLQERLQARIDKHRDPRGNICLGTYNHWDSALDLEAIGSLDAAQAEIARLEEAERVLEHNGFRRCDIAACNCNSWHFVGGFKARFDEIKQVVEDAGYSTNGRTLLDAVKHMAKDATPLPVAEDVVGRNAALQEAAAHLRDMGYWTQGAAVLSLCTGVCTGACTGGSSDGR